MACGGMSYYEVGRLLGVSYATVSNWARKAGIVRGECNCIRKGARDADDLLTG